MQTDDQMKLRHAHALLFLIAKKEMTGGSLLQYQTAVSLAYKTVSNIYKFSDSKHIYTLNVFIVHVTCCIASEM
jgi:hypothetical protein